MCPVRIFSCKPIGIDKYRLTAEISTVKTKWGLIPVVEKEVHILEYRSKIVDDKVYLDSQSLFEYLDEYNLDFGEDIIRELQSKGFVDGVLKDLEKECIP